MMSKRFLDSLDDADKVTILEAFEEAKLYERKLIRDGEKEIMAKLADKGVTVYTLTPEERARWAEATKGVYNQFEKRIGKDLIERAKATIAAGK